MSKRLLIRLMAILAVVALAVAMTFGCYPIVVAAVTFGALTWGQRASSEMTRDGPDIYTQKARRRCRAHEASQNYLSQFNTAPSWPDSGGRARPFCSEFFQQFFAGKTSYFVAGAQHELKISDAPYRARDRPFGLLHSIIGQHDPAVSVP